MLTLAASSITIVLGAVGISTTYDASKERGRETIRNATELVIQFIDDKQLDEIMDNRVAVSEAGEAYTAANSTLMTLKKGFPDIENIYIYQMVDNAFYMVLNTSKTYQEEGVVGEKIESGSELLPVLPDLAEGNKIPLQEIEKGNAYLIARYDQIVDEEGKPTNYYVGADISLTRRSTEIKNFAIKTSLVFSGFFIMILSFGFWMTGYYIVYPIGSLAQSIDSFIKSFGNQSELDESIKKLQKLDIRTNDEIEQLYKMLCQMAVGTSEQMRSIRLLAKSNEKMQNGLIITMADMVENRDSDTGAHIQKTAAYVRILLEALRRKGYYTEKLTDKYINDVEMSAPLHDIGKINVPDAVLNKPGKLTNEEFEIMKTHTTAGMKILERAIDSTEGENYLKEARNMAAYHHERWDGKGYPEGLHGEVIPLSARVMAVADVFDALTSPRVYKPAFPVDRALDMISEGAGTQFDPKVVEAFMDSLPDVKAVLKKFHNI
jgi:response regulator RpfG family c-di-GMP phosphodiesterase